MGLASERYEQAAQQWDTEGRPEPPALGWYVMKLSCWMSSAGGKHDGASDTLKAFHDAVRRSVERENPDWLNNLFDGHEYCLFCGQSWRAENCGFCTCCSKAYPPCCIGKHNVKTLPNGNFQCGACGEGEIVG